MNAFPLLFLSKSLVPSHTRRLKTGKVVRVRQYSNKVTKRPDDDGTLDMFSDSTEDNTGLFGESARAEPRKDLIAEHKRLVDVLDSPSHADDKAEAKRQREELDEYESKDNDNRRIKALMARAKALGLSGGGPGLHASLMGYLDGKNPAGVVMDREVGIAGLEQMLEASEAKSKIPKIVAVHSRPSGIPKDGAGGRATQKQITYALSLLAKKGYSTRYMDASFKKLGCRMRERSGLVSEWLAGMTMAQASELIDTLKS
jgi:hypothetical protein